MNLTFKTILILCIVLLIALAGYAYFIADKVKSQNILLAEIGSKYDECKTEVDSNAEKISQYSLLIEKLEIDYSSRKTIDEDPLYNEYKGAISFLIEEKINGIAPEKPLHGGKWFVNKISFIGPTFAIVDYEDGHDIFSMLVQIKKTPNSYSFKLMK